MRYFKIVFDNGMWNGRRRNPIYVKHWNGSQLLFCEINELVGDKPNWLGFPLCLEIDGWGDDMACEGDVYETDEGFNVECISEEEYNEYMN